MSRKKLLVCKSKNFYPKFFVAMGILLVALVFSFIIVSAQSGTPAGWPSDWQWPVPGQPDMAGFGENNSAYGGEKFHSGVDIGTASNPAAAILAANNGIVKMVQDGGMGIQKITIVLYHGQACDGTPVSTVYAHTRDPIVSVGQVVTKGQQLATAYRFDPPNGVEPQWHLHFMYVRASDNYRYDFTTFADPYTLPRLCTWWDGSPVTDANGVPEQPLPAGEKEWRYGPSDMDVQWITSHDTLAWNPQFAEDQPTVVAPKGQISFFSIFAFIIAVCMLMLMIPRETKRYAPAWVTCAVLFIGIGLLVKSPGSTVQATEPIAAMMPTVIPTETALPQIVFHDPALVMTATAIPVVYPTQPVALPQPTAQYVSGDCAGIASFFCETPVGTKWSSHIVRWAQAAGITPDQSATIMLIESFGDENAHSGGGACGLYQLMPSTFGYSCEAMLEHELNARLGNEYYAGLLQATGGDIIAAAAGYNGGPRAREWFLGIISRDDYISFLMNHPYSKKYGTWDTWEEANDKAEEVEAYTSCFKIANEAEMGIRTTFDKFMTLGRYHCDDP